MSRKRPSSARWNVPREVVDLAKRRTEFLLGMPAEVASLQVLLANAYLAGLADAADAIEPRP